MNINPLVYTLDKQRSSSHVQILANWVEAAFNLHENYKRLIICLSQAEAEKGRNKVQPLFIGQCPTDQLVGLLMNMHEELENLLLDMDKVESSNPASHKKNYKKLASHTIILNRLNQQAQTRLLLATFTSA
ncbi:hypothetical protein [Spirosoma pollinicola]|uniref:Uncharacterized protein n=1 Tax=Spirosoma pollinicola TaxID=2057025 RepID=A0A2K8YV21_9BACT|nr:hypothetical protein [Spirosoma pollinicola]AUD01466.1 hypothetical protein CWM47_06355 [Spirosoma pollinicola]